MYSVYSIPNVFLPMAGGGLVDKVGLYFSLNLFSSLILFGQIVFAFGCSASSLSISASTGFNPSTSSCCDRVCLTWSLLSPRSHASHTYPRCASRPHAFYSNRKAVTQIDIVEFVAMFVVYIRVFHVVELRS